MWVRYFVPEDGDDPQHPNVYKIEKQSGACLVDIRSSFPLPGRFHFRFLKEIEKITVWLDVVDDGSPLPTVQGSILVKASRLDSASSDTERVRSNPSVSRSEPTTTKQRNIPAPPVEREASEKLLNFSDDVPAAASSSGAALKGTSSSVPTPIPVAVAASAASSRSVVEDDLLGFGSAPSAPPPKASTSNTDLFGLETLQPMSAPSGPMGGSGLGISNPMATGYYASGPTSHSPLPMGGGKSAAMNSLGGGGPAGGMPRPMGGGPMGGGQGYDPFGNLGRVGGGPQGGQAPQNPFNRPMGGMQQQRK